jgi:membrane-associated phospholipid phosphatase
LNATVHAPYEHLHHGTFPSGHTQTAFSVAALMALLFRRHRVWWFSWAALVGLSRVYLGSHFPLDVLAGGCIGAVVSAGTYYGFMAKGWIAPPQRKSAFFLWE